MKINLSIFLILLCVATVMAQTDGSHKWELFHYEELLQQHEENNKNYLRFLDRPSMSMGLYRLKAGDPDPQNPHQLDEIYIVMKGSGTLISGNGRTVMKQGDIAFVKAKVDHEFTDITDDLEVLVIFSKTPYNPNDLDWQTWTMENLMKESKSDDNIWKQFIDVATLRMGLYMLPAALEGDKTLTHQVDEVNIVMKGSGKFKMDDESIDVKPGSIFWVKQGVGHYFYDLKDDMDILILFVK